MTELGAGRGPTDPVTTALNMRDPVVYLVQGWTMPMDYLPTVLGIYAMLLPVRLLPRLQTSAEPDPILFWSQAGVTVLLESLATVALVAILPRMYNGEAVSVKDALRRGFTLWGPYLLVWIRWACLVLVGLFLFVAPGIYLLVSFSLFSYAVVLEGHPRPLQRSWLLVEGYRFRILFLGAVFFVYPLAEVMCLVILEQIGQTYMLIPFAFFDLLYLSLMTIVLYLVYVDLTTGEGPAPGTAASLVDAKPDPGESA